MSLFSHVVGSYELKIILGEYHQSLHAESALSVFGEALAKNNSLLKIVFTPL
jgi:hypothetical protein